MPADRTEADQWQSQIFARILKDHHVICISEAPKEMVSALHMTPAESLEEALEIGRLFGES